MEMLQLPPSALLGFIDAMPLQAKAREMESIRGQRFGGGLSAQRRKERLAKAAELYARVGDTRKYCEILIELGKWDQAIAIAPSVSMEYWRELCRRNAERLEEEQDHKAVSDGGGQCALSWVNTAMRRLITSLHLGGFMRPYPSMKAAAFSVKPQPLPLARFKASMPISKQHTRNKWKKPKPQAKQKMLWAQ